MDPLDYAVGACNSFGKLDAIFDNCLFFIMLRNCVAISRLSFQVEWITEYITKWHIVIKQIICYIRYRCKYLLKHSSVSAFTTLPTNGQSRISKYPLWLEVSSTSISITCPVVYCLTSLPFAKIPPISWERGLGSFHGSPQTPHLPPLSSHWTKKCIDYLSIYWCQYSGKPFSPPHQSSLSYTSTGL